jgi:hypothetical protein
VYDIYALEGLKNPKISSKRIKSHSKPNLMILESSVNITKDFDIDGFTGTLKKEVIIKHTAKLTRLVLELNTTLYAQYKLRSELSTARYNCLLLETDKSIKRTVINNLVGAATMKKLLK